MLQIVVMLCQLLMLKQEKSFVLQFLLLVCDILKISNMANQYLNNDYGFFSQVFGCRVILYVIGITLVTKKIVHRKPINYPSLTLPP